MLRPMSPPRDEKPADAISSPRIVLLGASNLTRAISCIIGSARLRLGMAACEPLEAMIAYGHGRSFVIDSTILIRTLPGIEPCALWRDLRERAPSPTYALVTDIGNDIMYDVPPATILDAVRQCMERCADVHARIVLAGLPMRTIGTLSAPRFRAVRRVLFPTCRISHAQAMNRAEFVNEGLISAAGDYKASFVDPDPTWYGVDPIHIRWKHWPRAWRTILESWNPEKQPPPAPAGFSRWLDIRTRPPRHWKVLGRDLAHRQPVRGPIERTHVLMY